MSGAAALASAAAFAMVHLLVAWQHGSIALSPEDVGAAEKVLGVCAGVADAAEEVGSSVALALSEMRPWRTSGAVAGAGRAKSDLREIVLVAQSKLEFVGSLASATAGGGGEWQGVPPADARANGEDCFSCFGPLVSAAVQSAGNKLRVPALAGLDKQAACSEAVGRCVSQSVTFVFRAQKRQQYMTHTTTESLSPLSTRNHLPTTPATRARWTSAASARRFGPARLCSTPAATALTL